MFVTREEVPTLDSDLERKLERRLKPGRWSPWGMEVLWREGRGGKFISIKIAI